MKRWTSWANRGAVVALVAGGITVVLPVGPASAGGCDNFGCSEVENDTTVGATARKNWTCSWGTTASSSTGCVSGGSYYLPTKYSSTPSNEDWDVVQVDAGWCYKIHFNNWYNKSWDETYNRIGKSALYVKVENGSLARIVGQSSTSCP